MSAVIIPLPDPTRLRAGMESVRARAAALDAPADALRRALHVLLREVLQGRSTAAAVALANGNLRRAQARPAGGSDAA